MKLVVKRNRELAPINSQNTQNENRAETIELIVPEEYESFNKKIVFITPNETVWDVIINNEYKITNAITQYNKVDYYIWLTKEVDGESIDFRTKTKTLSFYHNEDASDEITPEEISGVNTVVNLLEEEITRTENLINEVQTKLDNGEFNGKDALINGMNEIELVAGNNIEIKMIGNKIIISATGISPEPTEDIQLLTSDNKIFITSNNANFIVKESD